MTDSSDRVAHPSRRALLGASVLPEVILAGTIATAPAQQ